MNEDRSIAKFQKDLAVLKREPFIIQFLVELFFVYFLPLLIGLIYFVLTSPWFDHLFKYEHPFTLWFMKGLVFTAAVFIIIHVYIFAVLQR